MAHRWIIVEDWFTQFRRNRKIRNLGQHSADATATLAAELCTSAGTDIRSCCLPSDSVVGSKRLAATAGAVSAGFTISRSRPVRPRNCPDSSNSAVSVAHAQLDASENPGVPLGDAVHGNQQHWRSRCRSSHVSGRRGSPEGDIGQGRSAGDAGRGGGLQAVQADPGEGHRPPPQPEGRPPFVRPGPEVQDAGASEPPRAVARSDREHGARPAGLDALLRPRDVRQGSGREHALGFPRGAGQGRRAG